MKTEKVCLDDFKIGPYSGDCLSIEEGHSNDVAIIGISAKFSNAANKDEFWNNLVSGKDCIKPFPRNRIADIEPFCEYLKSYIKYFDFSDPASYFAGGYLDDISGFDYTHFKISPNASIVRLSITGSLRWFHLTKEANL